MRARGIRVSLLALAGLCALSAQAQEGRATGAGLDPLRTLEEVTVTATRRNATTSDIAVAASVVGEEAFLAEPTGVVSELLRGVPGAFFQQTTPGQGLPIVRGLKGSQVLHLVDGMRLNNAFFRSAPNQYVALVDAFAVDRAEVVRGAAGSLYGADAMGGVVQFLTRTPRFEGRDWRTEGRLYAAWESADDALALRAEASGGREGTGVTAGVTWRDYGDRRTGLGTVRPTAYEVRAGDFKWLQSLGETTELTLSAQLLEQPSTPRVDELVPGYGQATPSSEQFFFEPNRRSFVHARLVHEGDGWYDRLELNAARQVIVDDRVNQDFGDPVVREESNESTLDGLTAQFDRDLGARAHLVWGAEFYTDEVRSRRTARIPDVTEPVEVRSRFPDGSQMDSLALYAGIDWLPTERLDLSAGLRWSDFDIFLPGSGDVPDTRLAPDDLSGDVHVVFALADGVNLVANVGRGFRPPNVFDLGTLGARPGNRFNVANPGLGPETVWSYDLGLKTRGDAWQAEAFAWYSDYRDRITSVFTGEQTATGRDIVRSENLSEVRLHGLEAGLAWWPSEDWEVRGALNYTRGEDRQPGEATVPADRIPPLNGRLGVAWDAGGPFRAEAFWLFAAAQDRLNPRDVDDPRIDPEGTAGWGTLNLRFAWRAGEALEWGLNLENLGDVAYREHGSGIDAPGFNAGVWANLRF